MPASDADLNRPETTAPKGGGRFGAGLVGRVKVALGGRDLRSEVAGYRLALDGAGESQVGVIVERLLELIDSDAGLDALTLIASIFDRIEPARRERALIAGHGQWGRAVGAAAIDVDPASRLSAATLIGRVCERDTFGALRELLADQDEGVASRAAQSLLTIAERSTRSPALDTDTTIAIERLVVRSVGEFDRHRRREAIGALLAIASSPAAIRAAGAELRAWFADKEHPAHMILRGMLRRGDGLASRESAWLWLARPEHRAGSVERLAAPCDTDAHERVLVRGHLLHNPARRLALTGAADRDRKRRTSGLTLDAETIAELSPAAQSRAPAWIAAVEIVRGIDALEALLTAPADHARLNTLRELSASPAADLSLDFCLDPAPRVARSAALIVGTPTHRAALGIDRVRRTLAALEFSATGPTRDTAGRLAAALDPLADRSAGLAAAWRMLRSNRPALAALLQSHVRAAKSSAVRAIQLATRLNVAVDLELELLSIIAVSSHAARTDGQDRRDVLHAAAAAVTALADLHSPAAQHAVHKCLRHPDDRVRANALDAISRAARRAGDADRPDTLLAHAAIEFKNDPHHRVRAGAARAAILSLRGAADAEGTGPVILPLLADPRPMHRVSGLWLAERAVGFTTSSGHAGPAESVAAAIAELVRTDPEPIVRVRARAAAGLLLAGMRTD